MARRARLLWDAGSSKSSFSEIKTIAAGAAGRQKTKRRARRTAVLFKVDQKFESLFPQRRVCELSVPATLDSETGLDRYALARGFRARFGTSPRRYLVGRRLERVTTEIAHGASLAAMSSTAIGSSLRSVREFVISASFRIESKSKFRHGVGPMRVGPTMRKKIVQDQFVRNGGRAHGISGRPLSNRQAAGDDAGCTLRLRAADPHNTLVGR